MLRKWKEKNLWNYSEFNIENGINLSYLHYLLKGFNLEKNIVNFDLIRVNKKWQNVYVYMIDIMYHVFTANIDIQYNRI